MAEGKAGPDILALIAQVHGGSEADVRDGQLEAAVGRLEQTHRQAARAMRDIETRGLKRARPQAPPASPVAPAAPAVSSGPPPGVAAAPAVQQAEAPEGEVPRDPATPVEVVMGQGADVDDGRRTLTHIVRPRGGR
jgi:hypothetical protein